MVICLTKPSFRRTWFFSVSGEGGAQRIFTWRVLRKAQGVGRPQIRGWDGGLPSGQTLHYYAMDVEY
jgi:hypothetical protein